MQHYGMTYHNAADSIATERPASGLLAGRLLLLSIVSPLREFKCDPYSTGTKITIRFQSFDL